MHSEKKKYKIALVDDHNLVREALADMLRDFENFEVVIEASTGEKLFEFLKAGITPDLVLLDLNMPGMGGKKTAQRLVSDYPDIRILMLSTHTTEVTISHLTSIGVTGFLNKDSSPVEFKIALTSVLELGQYYNGITTQKMIKMRKAIERGKENKNNITNKENSEKKNHGKKSYSKTIDDCLIITEEEIQFLQLVCTDLTYAGIAGEMKLRNERSADAMRELLFEKLDVRSRSGLVMFAVRNGIVNI